MEAAHRPASATIACSAGAPAAASSSTSSSGSRAAPRPGKQGRPAVPVFTPETTTQDLLEILSRAVHQKKPKLAIQAFWSLKKADPNSLAHLSQKTYEDLLGFVVTGKALPTYASIAERKRKAIGIWRTSVGHGIETSLGMWRLILDVHALDGDVDQVQALLQQMRGLGIKTRTAQMLPPLYRVHMIAGWEKSGLGIWNQLVEIDTSSAPTNHLIETYILCKDVAAAMRTLEEFLVKNEGQLPDAHILSQLFLLLLNKLDVDRLLALIKMAHPSKALYNADICLDIVKLLITRGMPKQAVDLLDARQKLGFNETSKLVAAEVVAREALAAHGHAAAPAAASQLEQLPGVADDDALALIERVGPTADAESLSSQLSTHSDLSHLGSHHALLMLLRGYTIQADIESARVVFDMLVSRHLGIPEHVCTPLIDLVLARRPPLETLEMLESMVKANVKVTATGMGEALTEVARANPRMLKRIAKLRANLARLLTDDSKPNP
ncbi:hypothetical protein HK105_202526 [Polyrhizophydium stewartii]|uniref:Pentatricopeptide repeat-containing protein n=1 Tax=Polyrhizophydium stewartii TaxID=2732419 RepID=A0ABR4NF02_9FUNG